MNVLFVSAEVDPFAKVGGLADVVGSLPKALRERGIDARILMPYYAFIDPIRYNITHLISFQFQRRYGTEYVDIYGAEHNGIPVYFLRAQPWFGQERTVYSNWDGDVPRFIFFCQAVLEAASAIRDRFGWFPDIFHINDWHTGLVPFLIDQKRAEDERWRGVGTLLTIHNMAYQGEYVGGFTFTLGIPGRNHPDLQRLDLGDNMLAMAITYSDIITTVSPRYAVEIQYPYQGYGLDNLLRTRVPDLYGIVNGIDMDQWNPETDRLITNHFNADNFVEQRPPNKRQLQQDSDLPLRDDVLLIGLVSRLVEQKGLDLAFPALRQFLADNDVQFVGLGSGEPQYNDQLTRLGDDFPGRVRAFVGYNASVAQRIYAGSDVFLMPSHYEPCGTSQMFAMRYGSLPLVRETGGLADTVENYDDGAADRGTGFIFQWETPGALLGTLQWALYTYNERRPAWRRMQERAMRLDFSWNKGASEYIAHYEDALSRHQVSV
ncbi:MAG: glycosyltransferase [Chloroflexi bacterium]|nr:glycosyltransferase [Chloroflexota bacterium]